MANRDIAIGTSAGGVQVRFEGVSEEFSTFGPDN
jgi:hypothetical protein